MEKKLNQTQQSVVEVDGVSDVRDGKQLRNPIKPPCPPYDEAKLIDSLQEVTTSLQEVAKQTERLCQILSNRKSNHVIM